MTPRTVEQPTKVTPLRDGPSFHAAVLTTPRAYLTRRQNYAASFVLCVCVYVCVFSVLAYLVFLEHILHTEKIVHSVCIQGVFFMCCVGICTSKKPLGDILSSEKVMHLCMLCVLAHQKTKTKHVWHTNSCIHYELIVYSLCRVGAGAPGT